jgi:hypothetical protein
VRTQIITYLPWLLSAITIWMTVLAGNKHPSAWLIGLINQALWLGWIVASSAWGLLPMNIALWIVCGRNHFKWNAPKAAYRGATMRKGYSVTVSKHGEPILTIEREMLGGKAELSAEDEEAIRDAGEHLLSFIGPDVGQPPLSDDELPT